jgi:lipopolysaccharide transport system ATP-binding protein
VQQGDVLGIIGKNGAGKSTLLKILSKVTAPTTGTIKAAGRIASLLEVGTGFHPEMTGRENIYMNGAIMGMTKREITAKLDEIVDFSGVERYIDTPVKRYSSGMTVRLGFAIAAHLEPDILVVDEVLAVGDAEFQKKAIGKMQDVSKGEGRTVLFVSHNMTSIKALCTRGIILENGSVKYDGNIGDAVECYLKSDELNIGAPLMSKIKVLSKEISIIEVTVNGISTNHIDLIYPNRKLYIKVRGKALNKLRVGIECLLYDGNETLLGKFAPTLHTKETDLVHPGEFFIEEIVNLPHNMTNGDYFVQIEITHPKVEYLAVIPKGLKLTTQNYMSEQGIPFDYKLFGFLYL